MSATRSIESADRRGAAKILKWRIALIAVGLGLVGIGGLVMLDTVSPGRYLGILIWMAGAIIVHDGIIAPIVFAIGFAMRKAGRRIPVGVIAIIQAAIVVGAIVSLIVFPEVIKKSIGTQNPTVLPLDYGFNLVVFYVVIAALTAAALAAYLTARARRQKLRSASIQD